MEERSERCSGSKRKGEENEQWITKTSVLPHLFSLLLDFLRLLVVLQAILFPPSLPPSSSSLFLCPSPCFPRCRSSAAFLLPLLPDYCLLLFASLSVSISLTPAPPCVSVHCSSFLTLRGRTCTNDGPCSGHGPALPLSTHSKPSELPPRVSGGLQRASPRGLQE